MTGASTELRAAGQVCGGGDREEPIGWAQAARRESAKGIIDIHYVTTTTVAIGCILDIHYVTTTVATGLQYVARLSFRRYKRKDASSCEIEDFFERSHFGLVCPPLTSNSYCKSNTHLYQLSRAYSSCYYFFPPSTIQRRDAVPMQIKYFPINRLCPGRSNSVIVSK